VLTPTRELCIQVTQALRTYGSHAAVDVVAVFGGAPIRAQQARLGAGGQVVVGTVGRVLDLISRHSLILHECRFVVLDEADEMLDLGFLEDVERILALTPASRQTALFSATMPAPIRELADRYLYDPTFIHVEAATLTIDTVEQFQLQVSARDKPEMLVQVLRAEAAMAGEAPQQAIVFVRTKVRCELDGMRAFYVAGDLEAMQKWLAMPAGEQLLGDRNRKWLAQIEGYFAQGGAFVAVGLGHLIGPSNLPALLTAKGYTVERVSSRGSN